MPNRTSRPDPGLRPLVQRRLGLYWHGTLLWLKRASARLHEMLDRLRLLSRPYDTTWARVSVSLCIRRVCAENARPPSSPVGPIVQSSLCVLESGDSTNALELSNVVGWLPTLLPLLSEASAKGLSALAACFRQERGCRHAALIFSATKIGLDPIGGTDVRGRRGFRVASAATSANLPARRITSRYIPDPVTVCESGHSGHV